MITTLIIDFIRFNNPQRCCIDAYYDQCFEYVKEKLPYINEIIFEGIFMREIKDKISEDQYKILLDNMKGER